MTANVPLTIRRHQLVSTVREQLQNNDVLIALSGGPDSIALLLLAIAASLQDASNFSVVAGHVHHGLREESDEELNVVEALCNRFGVRCVSKRVQVQPKLGSIAAGAREARYEALCEIATEHNIQTIAVAQHAEDQLETMLMALCRGGGLTTLVGMASQRMLTDDISLIRPLLHVEKQTLIDICKDADVEWCEDPTNQDSSTPRGRLRQDVIPVLREIWPAADRHASTASSLLQPIVEAFDSLIEDGTKWERKSLQEEPHTIIAATMHRALGHHASYETILSITKAILDSSTEPRTFECRDGYTVAVTAHRVEIIYT